jgi:hypothetical protein
MPECNEAQCLIRANFALAHEYARTRPHTRAPSPLHYSRSMSILLHHSISSYNVSMNVVQQ